MHSFEEGNVGLEDLTEDSDEDKEMRRPSLNGRFSPNGGYNAKSEDR